MSYSLTVKELLNQSHFPKAKVIAGHQGLKKNLKWIHILETTNFGELIKGNELILTTGIYLKNESDFLEFVKQLIKKQVPALCIECCENIRKVPDSVVKLANKYQFPILFLKRLSLL
ncbi:hypothetical protein D1B33_15435 [Lysinibacillus yapensis]|uniref:Purine catabolism PurC-like domain-containing protein n=1 Tax=Ureibacillus yapensis TaxID=2304605 RepID=A0A396S7L4_9BACL|nr:PucR family transcriptional regulator ligand-binding domain-containing protein [Lysinibacillus yapensis]RHW33436.1 hypothetical protein D1B33_15435 [Lysinibacillus yapensis]